jgi:hypothetical protein
MADVVLSAGFEIGRPAEDAAPLPVSRLSQQASCGS